MEIVIRNIKRFCFRPCRQIIIKREKMRLQKPVKGVKKFSSEHIFSCKVFQTVNELKEKDFLPISINKSLKSRYSR